jgi:hypothetical protein
VEALSDRVHEDPGPDARGRSRINPRHQHGHARRKDALVRRLADPEITGDPAGKKDSTEHACCAEG